MILKIAFLRRQHEMTQTALAELCHTTQQQIAKIESGRGDPQLSTLMRIADALGVQVKDLFYDDDEFLEQIRHVVSTQKINFKDCTLLQLNELCHKHMSLPSFHPLWEQVEIKGQSIKLRRRK